MELIVIIPTTHRLDLLRRTLTSLSKCYKPENYSKTIVVENGPNFGAEEIGQPFGSSLNAEYLHVSEANKSAALNAALDQVTDALVYFTDDDVRFEPGVLRAYSQASKGGKERAIFGGPFGADWEREPPDWLKDFLPPSAKGRSHGEHVKEITEEGEFFNGLNWAAYADDIKAAGGFSTAMGPGAVSGSRGQEREMQLRLRARGLKMIYIPEAMVWHYVPWSRCSPRWALKRGFYNGAEEGLLCEPQNERIRILGNPHWYYQELARRGGRAMASVFSGDWGRRFLAYYRFVYYLGFMRGHWFKNKGRENAFSLR